jgi:hypothetical protein
MTRGQRAPRGRSTLLHESGSLGCPPRVGTVRPGNSCRLAWKPTASRSLLLLHRGAARPAARRDITRSAGLDDEQQPDNPVRARGKRDGAPRDPPENRPLTGKSPAFRCVVAAGSVGATPWECGCDSQPPQRGAATRPPPSSRSPPRPRETRRDAVVSSHHGAGPGDRESARSRVRMRWPTDVDC